MNNLLKIFRWIAVTILTGYLFYSSISLMQDAKEIADAGLGAGDFVTGWEERMERLKNRLPDDVSMIGYVTDDDLPGIETDPINHDNEYMLSQYSIAPIQVVPGLEAEWILGNFTVPDFQIWLDQSLGEYEIKNLGYGIYLIHRLSQ